MNTLITNTGQVATPLSPRSAPRPSAALSVYERADLLIQGGRIAAIGEAARGSERIDEEIDACGGAVLPGLIDPHTHFSSIVDAGSAPPDANPEVFRRAVRRRLRRALRSGVTTVEVKCSHLQELAELAALARSETVGLPGIVATLFGEAPAEGTSHAERMASLIADAIPTVRRSRLARFCDVACGDGAYTAEEARTILRAARAAGLQLKLHAACETSDAFGTVPADLGITAVGHVADLDERAASVWARAGVLPVLIPGDGLLGDRLDPDARAMLAAGLAVGLGTNAGGAPVAAGSMWLIIALAVGAMNLSLDQAMVSSTLHNASALESADEIGTIDVGKRADLIVLDVADYRDLLGGLGEEPVRMVIRGGEVVHRR